MKNIICVHGTSSSCILNRNQTGGFDVFFTQAILWQQADRGFARARGDDLLGIADIVDLLRIVAQFEKNADAADMSVLSFLFAVLIFKM